MTFNRRDLLKAGAAVSLVAGLPRQAMAQAP
ncbi:twin-arginine translocation signal domain-containing protein [Tardiphaga sp.]